MQLSEFPVAIATHQQAVAVAKEAKSLMEAQRDRLKAQMEAEVAFDANLKNDSQRKARLAELMHTPQMEQAQAALVVLEAGAIEAEIQLTLILNQFAVAKLEERRAIASLEMQAI